MISVVVCSRNATADREFAKNIADTIGCAYELILIDNSKSAYSIAQAYNRGMDESRFDYICCVHEDVRFHRDAWGQEILRIMGSDQSIGLIGVAGAKIKTRTPSGWWGCPSELQVVDVLQHYAPVADSTAKHVFFGFHGSDFEEVVTIDGVFMALRRDKRIRFDERLDGFHNYDVGISVRYKTHNYRVVVSQSVQIEHFSNGTVDKAWLVSSLKFHSLYHHLLPLTTTGGKTTTAQEYENFVDFFRLCVVERELLLAAKSWLYSFRYFHNPKRQLGFVRIALTELMQQKQN